MESIFPDPFNISNTDYYLINKQKKNPQYFEAFQFFGEENIEITEETPIEKLWEYHKTLLSKYHESRKKREVNEKEKEKEKAVKNTSLLDIKCKIAQKILHKCIFCENRCEVNRSTKIGKCNVQETRINSIFVHYGEEPEIIPSLTVFFTGCNLRCVHCQNWDLLNGKSGTLYTPRELAKAISNFVKRNSKIKNVNFVGGEPTPHLSFILDCLKELSNIYIEDPNLKKIPSIWNSNMYYSEEASELLDGALDFFLADLKYGNDKCAFKVSKRRRYTQIVHRNLLKCNQHADLLIRHLVLPGHVECCSKLCANWCFENLGKSVRYNLMFQYRPEHKATDIEEMARKLTDSEKVFSNKTYKRIWFN
ncbi:pyruvate formate-lyase activating enzyme [Anaeramoeba ignava]|uniref:Pyruvate formate-lyase activating enzyme n=1 Tax=Anaeramoeba ignava TaxID=1746090 RepID=A0A9Q0RFG9_ANAIG|nr:pyruvate formate-lyase activating enzyme [Anaeramoeba ignava]